MTVNITTRLQIGDVNGLVDFTSRLAGFRIDQPIRLSRASQHQAVITLLNNDGALTPNAGGTYSSTDWFAQAIDIDVSTDGGASYAPLFNGIITDFEVSDNGTNSTVQIIAHDWLQFLGRATSSISVTSGPLGARIEYALEVLSVTSGEMPRFGGTSQAIINVESDSSTNAIVDIEGLIGRDLNNSLMASNLCAAWSTDIFVSTSTNFVTFKGNVIGDQLTTTAPTIELVEGSPTAGQIPFSFVDVGYQFDVLVNRAEFTRDGGTKQTAEDTTSIQKYGARTVISSRASNSTDADALAAAQNIVNRQSNTTFTPRFVRLSKALVDGLTTTTGDNLETLLNATSCGFLPITLEYTPTGAGSPTTTNCITFGRTITAVPGRFNVEIGLLPLVNFGSFVLDSSTLGVLDTNRLG